MADVLFHRFGGPKAVARVVLAFYDRVLASERLRPFFAEADMRRLVDHQAKFLASVMGGPASHTDEELQEAHAHLPIADAHFDEVRDLLAATLRDCGMAEPDVAAVIAEIERRRPWIVQVAGSDHQGGHGAR